MSSTEPTPSVATSATTPAQSSDGAKTATDLKIPGKKSTRASVKKTLATVTASAAKSSAKADLPVAKKTSVEVSAKASISKTPKPKKPKLVRDSFTIPKAEYAVLEELKQRATQLASPVKKTELLRAGIKALAVMSDAGFLAALKAVPAIKTGRPAKD